MGFNGGGGGALPPHEHTNIANDGGPLDMNNATVGSLTQGSVVYSDGAALQELAIGVAGELLEVNGGATAPQWAAAPGASVPTKQYVTTTVQWTTSSTSFVDITNMTLSLPAGSGRSFCCFNSFYQQSGSSGFWRWECSSDGTQQESKITSTSGEKMSICLPYITDTNGAQTVKIQSKNDNGNTNYFAVDTEGPSTIQSWQVA
jgi:hypothetical protein